MLLWRRRGNTRASLALALAALGPALRLSKIVPDDFVEPRCSLPTTPTKTRKPPIGRLRIFGGGGGNRTPVRRRSAPGATCLVRRSISSRSSTPDEAHRGTSQFCFGGWSTGGNHQRSRDDDPTSTSTGTSGFEIGRASCRERV